MMTRPASAVMPGAAHDTRCSLTGVAALSVLSHQLVYTLSCRSLHLMQVLPLNSILASRSASAQPALAHTVVASTIRQIKVFGKAPFIIQHTLVCQQTALISPSALVQPGPDIVMLFDCLMVKLDRHRLSCA